MHPVEALFPCSDIAFLDASFSRSFVSGDIPKVLEAAPILHCLVITDALVSPTRKYSSWYKISSLAPCLWKASSRCVPCHGKARSLPGPITFTLVNVRDMASCDLDCAAVLSFAPAQVVQAIYDVLPWGGEHAKAIMTS